MKKLKILTSQAAPGMVIAEDVYTTANQLIVSAGTAITNRVITRLKFYSIHQITVSVENDVENLLSAPMQESKMYSDKVRSTHEFKAFNASIEKSTEKLRGQLSDLVEKNTPLDEDAFLSDVSSVLSNARNGMHVFDMLHSMRSYDDETYVHSINVALICNVLGRWLHFSKHELDIVTMCGLLHDIGKLLIPPEIMKKPGKLTEEEYNTVKTHSQLGYNILRAQSANIHFQMAAMMHHERCDGSGYPLGLKGNQIDRFAKIVMVADVYEAMTAARVYRGPLCPFEVVGIFESEGLSKYDTRAVMTFLEHVNQTYLSYNVRLNDQSEGVIVMMNTTNLSRPVIQVGDRFIDLAKEPDLYIESIL